MRVLVAPDKFAGTLTAVEAAEAIAEGWARHAPDDELDLAPMSDGGPGFVDVLHAALGGELLAQTVRGPLGDPVPATVLSVRRDGVRRERPGVRPAPDRRRGRRAGDDVRRGRAGPGRGRGRSHDRRGRARRQRHQRRGSGPAGRPGRHVADAPLDAGRGRLRRHRRVDLAPARAAVAGVRLVAATDVESPLTGLFGATKTFGPQKGIPEERLPVVDGWLEQWAGAVDRRLALEKGAGAAGGLGFALLAARRDPRAGHRAGRRGGGPAGPGRGRRPRRHRGGGVRLLQPVGQGARTASRRSRRPRCGRAWRWPGRCSSAPGRCGRSAWSRRTPWSTWSGRSARSATPPERWPTWPSGSREPGRASSATRGITPRCATIDPGRSTATPETSGSPDT